MSVSTVDGPAFDDETVASTSSKSAKVAESRRVKRLYWAVACLLTVVILQTVWIMRQHAVLLDKKKRLYAAQRELNLLTPKFSACEITEDPPDTLPYYGTYKNEIGNYTGHEKGFGGRRRLSWDEESWRMSWSRQQGSTTIQWEILKYVGEKIWTFVACLTENTSLQTFSSDHNARGSMGGPPVALHQTGAQVRFRRMSDRYGTTTRRVRFRPSYSLYCGSFNGQQTIWSNDRVRVLNTEGDITCHRPGWLSGNHYYRCLRTACDSDWSEVQADFSTYVELADQCIIN